MKVQTRLFRTTVNVMDTTTMNAVCDDINAQVNGFLNTLAISNVLDVQTYISPVGKYGQFTCYQTIVTYLE